MDPDFADDDLEWEPKVRQDGARLALNSLVGSEGLCMKASASLPLPFAGFRGWKTGEGSAGGGPGLGNMVAC